MNGNRRLIIGLFVGMVIVAIFCAGAVLAADGGTTVVFEFDPDEADVSAGEEVTLDLTIRSQGDTFGNGLNAYEFRIGYHPDLVSVTNVEHGNYLEEGGLEMAVDEERDEGELFIRHQIADREKGVRGAGVTASVTFEVVEDADPTNVEIAYVDTRATYVPDHPAPTFRRSATIAVDGGGHEDVSNGNDSGGADNDNGVGVIRPDDDRNAGADDGESDDSTAYYPSDGDDTIPGFGAGTPIGIVLATWLARRSANRSSDAVRDVAE